MTSPHSFLGITLHHTPDYTVTYQMTINKTSNHQLHNITQDQRLNPLKTKSILYFTQLSSYLAENTVCLH